MGNDIREVVRERYGQAALRAGAGGASSCCGGSAASETLLLEAGFEAPAIEPTRVYDIEDARTFLTDAGLDVDALAPAIEGRFISAFVRATKPVSAPAPLKLGVLPLAGADGEVCCGPGCCA